MSTTHFKKIEFYYRTGNAKGIFWEKKLGNRIKMNYPKTQILEPNAIPRTKKDAPGLLIVLGGDGTILEAAQKFQKWNPLIFGLNLGHVGFLASVREKTRFLSGIARVFRHEFR